MKRCKECSKKLSAKKQRKGQIRHGSCARKLMESVLLIKTQPPQDYHGLRYHSL